MSKNLTVAAVQSFDSLVKQAYQGQAVLRPSVRVKSGVVGKSHRFTVIGRGVASPRVPQTDVTPMNIGYTNATAAIEDWNAPEYTDIFDQQKVNFDERQQLAMVVAGAIGRREDQLIIDSWIAGTPAGTVATSVGGADTNLNTAKMTKAKQILDQKNVPPTDRHFAAHSNNLFGLLGDEKATNQDYNVIRALVQGEINTWLGFTHVYIGDRDEGGFPIATNVRDGFAYHGGSMGSTGLAVGIDFRTEIHYIPEKTSWLVNGLYAGGAVVIDGEGYAKVQMNESAV